jgi:hypothetical protein
MATWADWLKIAREKGVPLHETTNINLAEDIKRLNNSGLPVYDLLLIEGKDYQKDKKKIKEFSEKHDQCWVRIYSKQKEERYHKLDLKSYNEIVSFIENLSIDLKEFIIQVFEYHTNKFGCNVISDGENVNIEMVRGVQDIVDRGNSNSFNGVLTVNGILTFREENVSEDIKKAAKKILSYLRLSRNEYIKGYFEIAFSDEDEVYFLDYKTNLKI